MRVGVSVNRFQIKNILCTRDNVVPVGLSSSRLRERRQLCFSIVGISRVKVHSDSVRDIEVPLYRGRW